jgi:hypothetical protein
MSLRTLSSSFFTKTGGRNPLTVFFIRKGRGFCLFCQPRRWGQTDWWLQYAPYSQTANALGPQLHQQCRKFLPSSLSLFIEGNRCDVPWPEKKKYLQSVVLWSLGETLIQTSLKLSDKANPHYLVDQHISQAVPFLTQARTKFVRPWCKISNGAYI